MTGDEEDAWHLANPMNVYNDIYYGMILTISGHPEEIFNGIYTALDYFYDAYVQTRHIYFKNNNNMYLYYYPIDGEAYGYWRLHLIENPFIQSNSGGEMKYCFSYMCLYY